MLNPVIGYGIKGAIFYQGEDNVPRYQDYAQQLQTMVGCWRDNGASVSSLSTIAR